MTPRVSDGPLMPQPCLSPNALQVLDARYLRRDDQRRVVETPAQLFERVAAAVAQAEVLLDNEVGAPRWRESFHRQLSSLEFLPNSPTLMNAGAPLGQLSACFVLPVPDTMEGIFEAVKQMALIQRSGGGTGFSFSHLRPRGDLVASTGGESSGPVSFMKIFDCATENIKQGGRRRGANMGVLRVDHPDILDFIDSKRDGRSLQNFNLSVAVTDTFMAAVGKDDRFALKHPGSGRGRGTIPARQIFNAIVDAAWQTGDPGLLFLDAINRANPTPALGVIDATNPCGEVPLLPWESCNLGSLNLARMVEEHHGHTDVNWDRLSEAVRLAVRFLDDVIEVNRFPLPQIADLSRANRKLGLGVMGFAEMLIRLGIPYDSPAAVEFADRVMGFIARAALQASEALAVERGPFANWPSSIWEKRGLRLRHATLTAIAPTGTIGIIAGASPSIEPLFALAYRRANVLDGRTLLEVNPLFREYLERYHLSVEPVMREILVHGHLDLECPLPTDFRRLFATALEIPAEQHLQIQAAFQRHVHNSVSKTINLPETATRQDIGAAYTRAWELGLKGVTVYRYGSRSAQVFVLGTDQTSIHFEHASRCDPEECRL